MKSTDALAELAGDPDALPEVKSLFEQLAAPVEEDLEEARKDALNKAEEHYLAPIADLLTAPSASVKPETFDVIAAVKALMAALGKKKDEAAKYAFQVVNGRQRRQEARKQLVEAMKHLSRIDAEIELSDMTPEQIAEREAGRN